MNIIKGIPKSILITGVILATVVLLVCGYFSLTYLSNLNKSQIPGSPHLEDVNNNPQEEEVPPSSIDLDKIYFDYVWYEGEYVKFRYPKGWEVDVESGHIEVTNADSGESTLFEGIKSIYVSDGSNSIFLSDSLYNGTELYGGIQYSTKDPMNLRYIEPGLDEVEPIKSKPIIRDINSVGISLLMFDYALDKDQEQLGLMISKKSNEGIYSGQSVLGWTYASQVLGDDWDFAGKSSSDDVIHIVCDVKTDNDADKCAEFTDKFFETIEIVTNDDFMEVSNTNKKMELVGICGLDGSAVQYDMFSKNPCKIINSETNEIMITIKNTSCEDEEVCINAYSELSLLGEENGIQYILIKGGEGGGSWGSIYSLDLLTKEIELLDKYNYGSEGMGSTRYEGDPKVFIDVYNGKSNCTGNGYECSIDLLFKDSDECMGWKNPFKYVPECFENWNELSEDAKNSQLIEFEKIKNTLQSVYTIELEYMLIFNSLLNKRVDSKECEFPNSYNDECRLMLTRVDSKECNDPFNNEAYTENCLIGWEMLSQEQKINFKKFPETYTEIYGPRFKLDYKSN